jgi:WD40 repeat protein
MTCVSNDTFVSKSKYTKIYIVMNTNSTLRKFLLGMLLFAGISCQKEWPAPPIEITTDTDQFAKVVSDPGLLSNRLSLENRLVVWEEAGDDSKTLTPSNDIIWTYVADVTPLNYQGQTLSATHVNLVGDYAIVSYHVRGDLHLGGVEIIDITDGEQPIVISQAFFQHADVNAITVEPGSSNANLKVWAALSDKNKGAVLARITIINGVVQNSYDYVDLSSFLPNGISASANGLVVSGNYVYVSSGKTYGGVFCFDVNTLEYIGHTSFSNAKYVAANGEIEGISQVVSLQTGNNASLRTASLGQTDFATIFPIASISHQNTDTPDRGKNSMQISPDNSQHVYIAMGNNGLHVYDITTGALVYSTPPGFLGKGNTNGLKFHGDLFYVANGADGLAVFRLPEVSSDPPELVFVWDLGEENASANFVEAQGEWIFVAKGQGGVKILRQPDVSETQALAAYDNQGVPQNLAPDEPVCATLLPQIFSTALPEGQNAIVAHPEYFENDVLKEIFVQEDADVFLTFLHEGAGYRNTLGYYYYDINNPPSSVEELSKIVIFPNASASGSGGNLQPGNTMELLGSFDANTVIGFFLIADGWKNGTITDGRDIQYTIPAFNDYGDTQTIIFHDSACNSTVICFEDINVTSGGDRDYNDAIFQIRTEPASAIAVGDYLSL